MGFELGQTYSEYEFLDVVKRSRSIIAYRVRNASAQRLELLQVLPQTAQDDAEQVERFLRETRVRANLRHPNIAAFYNAAPLEGQWVMTTELVEGPTLAERLQLGPLPWPQAVGLAIQALSALSCAHEHDIIHRDISAESIVVTNDGTLKLSNFALAKTANGPQLTQAGAIIGNLRYISPEQIRGGELDARSDIYSLGVVLYEMLCGAPPFDSRSQFELMLAHVNKAPLPPSVASPGVPEQLDAIVLRALAKDPNERYQSGAEFAEALLAVGLGGSEAPAEAEPAPEPTAPAPAPVTEAVAETAPEPIAAEPAVEPAIEPIVEPAAEAAQTELELPAAQPAAELEPEAEPVPQPEPAFVPFALLAPPALPAEAEVEQPSEPAPPAAVEPEPAAEPEPIPEPVAAFEAPDPAPPPLPEAPEEQAVLAAIAQPKPLSLQWAVLGGAAAGVAAMALTIWLMSGS